MNTQFMKLGSCMIALMLVLSPVTFADENEVVKLKEKVDILMKKVSALEKRGEKKGSAYIAPTPAEGGMISTAQGIEMGGHLDIQWNNNFRQPAGVAGANAGRIFDNDDGSFTVNSAELWFENLPEEVGETGFRVNLAFGEDTGVVAADGLTGDSVDLQEAYVQYIAPLSFFEGSDIVSDQVTLTAGRFATLAGMEVIEGPDNWNISRSFLFGLAIPFIHTGIRANWGMFNDYFDVSLGLNNGWDLAVDNNSFKTLETGVGYDPIENVSVYHAFYWGGEKMGNPAGKRWVLTNTVIWEVTDKLTVMGDFDYGAEHGIGSGTTNPNIVNDADWWGFAGYARYQINDKTAVSYRGEIFVDDAIFRGFGSDRTYEQTLTFEYALSEQMIARAEVRYDKSNDDNPFGGSSSQTTIGAQLLYLI